MPRAVKKKKFYGVKIGRTPGVYQTWPEAERQVINFKGALHASFATREEAEIYVNAAKDDLLQRINRAAASNLTELPGAPKSYNMSGEVEVKEEDTKKKVISQEATKPNTGLGPTLSPAQRHIFDRIVSGENFFFTGSAGTGKSVLLRAIITELEAGYRRQSEHFQAKQREMAPYIQDMNDEELRAMQDEVSWKDKLAVTASTGMAGVNIGGCTLHSWAGIGLGKESVEILFQKCFSFKPTLERWQRVKTLIVDEISMMDALLLEKLEELGRRLRRDDRPFGGIQVIFSGDFYQLPPVPDRDNNLPARFAFEADCWNTLFPTGQMKALTQVYRQRDDSFVKILERMRRGQIWEADIQTLKRCDRSVAYNDGIDPVSLYPSKIEVARINAAKLALLETPVQIFMAFDVPGRNSRGYNLTHAQASELLDRNTIWPKELQVKVGALVMLVTNLKEPTKTLVNGSTGIVTDLLTVEEAHQQGHRVSAPSVGMMREKTKLPLVTFAPPAHLRGPKQPPPLVYLVTQHHVDVLNARSEAEATRHQIPLILAWGLTIHKSQGQSIDRLRVDLNRIFESGQTYVALSRATNLDTLEIRNFAPNKVLASRRVIDWSRPLEEEQALDEEWDDLVADVDLDELAAI